MGSSARSRSTARSSARCSASKFGGGFECFLCLGMFMRLCAHSCSRRAQSLHSPLVFPFFFSFFCFGSASQWAPQVKLKGTMRGIPPWMLRTPRDIDGGALGCPTPTRALSLRIVQGASEGFRCVSLRAYIPALSLPGPAVQRMRCAPQKWFPKMHGAFAALVVPA